MKGWVFDIQHFSLHDGPGIRTTVFLQGCRLNCSWCHNPEGLSIGPQLQYFDNYCIGCGDCFRVCRRGVHYEKNGVHKIDWMKCDSCGECVENCCSNALGMTSCEMDAVEVVKTVARDKTFYDKSGGGVTLSGGEPLVQLDFSIEVLTLCHEAGIRTAIDTSLYDDWTRIERILPHCDLVLADLKMMDPADHERRTGVSNGPILENLKRLSLANIPFIVRTPIIPTVNDDEETILAMADFLKDLENLSSWEWVAFHRLGEGKHATIGSDTAAAHLPMIDREKMVRLARRAETRGVPIKGADDGIHDSLHYNKK